MNKIAVLIPCYNEEKTVANVIRDFKKMLPEALIYVFNNNSTDKTAEIAESEEAIVINEYMQGKGNVIRRMFRMIEAESYIIVDGDDTYSAENAREMINLVLEHNADMVIGDRLSSTYYSENKRCFHNFGNDLVKFCINLFFNANIKDVMTGYRAFSYQFVKTFPVLSKGFEIETEMTIHALRRQMQVENIVIKYKDRPEGSESKLNTFSDGFKVIKMIALMLKNYRPLVFWGYISFVLFLISIIFAIPVFSEYVKSGLVLKLPTLIVCGFVMLAALLIFLMGLQLSNQLAKDERDFEFQLNLVNHWKEERQNEIK